MTIVTERDNDTVVQRRVGDEIVIRLPENATTGYRWAVEQVDARYLAAVSPEARYDGAGTGSGGVASFVFRAMEAGRGEIRLRQWRSWEGERSVIARLRLVVEIAAPE